MNTQWLSKFFSAFLIVMLALASFPVTPASAFTTAEIVPTANGFYTAWSNGYLQVDEGTAAAFCGGAGPTTDYIDSGTANARESVVISLASVPNGAIITGINVLVRDSAPSLGQTGGTYATFIRFNGVDSANSATHTASAFGDTCPGSHNDPFVVTPTVKGAGTTLEIGVIKINSGGNTNRTVRVGVLSTIVTYILPTTLTVSAASGTYGDTVNLSATLSPAVAGKLINFTINGVSVGLAFTNASGVASLSSISLDGINAGVYPGGAGSGVGASFAGDADYGSSSGTATLTVNPRPASVTPNPASKTYGDPDPAFTGTLTGFLPADGVTVAYSRTPGETVAGSPYTISATLSPASVLSNYAITYNTADFTINPANLLITASSGTMVYGGTVPTITPIYTGLQAGDTQPASPPTCSTMATSTSPVAGSPYTSSCTGAVDSNYTITYATGTVTVTPADLLITASSDTMVYGGIVPIITPIYSGLQAGDTQTDTPPTCSTVATSTSPVAGSPYTSSCSGAVDSNYSITYANGAVTVTPADLLITASSDTMVYGGVVPTITPIYNGLQAGDTETATPPACSTTATSTSTVAGNPYTSSCTGAVDSNYTITYATGTVTITPRDASVTPNPAGKTYGDADPVLTGTLTGFLPADNVTATYSRTAGETVAGSPYTIGATLSPAGVLGNYNITYNTADFTITQRAASVTPNAASKTYGDSDPAFTGTLTGFLPADGVTATYSRTAGDTVAGSPYIISAVLSPAGVLGNYNITYNTANFTINPRSASVTPNPAGKTYGDVDPVFSGTLTGFLPADNVTATYTRTPGETVAGSPYTISATLAPAGVLGNYNITYNTAGFTITQRAASVTPNAASKTYGDADPAFNGTLTGFLSADGVTATYSRTPGETVAGSPYTISATLSPAGVLGNYNITYNTADFNITQRSASVTPNAASKTYGDSDPVLTGILTGFLPADGVTATYSRTAGETVAGSPYTINAILAPVGVLNNYTITYNTANFTITARTASVTPNPASKVYGDTDPILTGSLSGFLPADGVTATYSRTAGETVAGSPYTISATLAPAGVLGNYNITYNTANFTITLRTASVTPNAASKTYGDADPVLTGTLSGFLPADGITSAYSRTPGETVAGSPYTISATLSPAGALVNYNITYNTANFTITQRAASVLPNPASKTYGDPDPALGGTLAGFLPADGVTATYSRTAGETVAGSPYIISATLAPAGVLGNYTITYNTATFTITQRAASVTPNAASKIYGDPDPVLTGTLTGFLPADGVTATYSRTPGETVAGSPYIISATLAPAGVLGNYNITYNTANFTIGTTSATVTLGSLSHTYDGTPKPVTVITTPNGLPVSITYDGSPTAPTNAGSYAVAATITDPNYSGSANDTLVINPATVTSSINAGNKVYDGTTAAAFTCSLSGVIGADTVSCTGGTANFADKNVGVSKTVTATGLGLGGAQAGNYQLSSTTANGTANITSRILNVSATGINKVYDGNTNATATLSDDRIGGDVLTLTYTSASFADPNVGAAKPVSVLGISISGGTDAGNYTLGNTTAATTANITIAGQTITVTTSAPSIASNGSTFNVAATASSGLPVSITTGGGCSGSGTSSADITMTSGTGICSVFYNQAGNANYSAAPQVQEDVTATESPSFTSANNTSFDVGFAGTFNITAVGNPSTMTISLSGILPSGVTFNDNGDGTATLSGTPALGSNGTYPLIFTANNGTPPNGIQNFTFSVRTGPVVIPNGVGSFPDTGNGSVSENEVIVSTLNITQLTVEFNQDVYNPAGDTDPDDVTNPANYMLVRGSASGVFSTVSCSGGVVAPDTTISVDSAVYSNGGGSGPFVATLNINGGFPLNVAGFYRLYVCGTTSIVDAVNTGLALAGNGTNPGTDFVRNFRLQDPIIGGGGGSGSGGGGTGTSATVIPSGLLIPVTGFTPDQVTHLPNQPAANAYVTSGLKLEVPSLGMNLPIVGVELKENGWDVTWLGNNAGYLEGSAYPTWKGNTVLTGHVTDANGKPGAFAYLKELKRGDKIHIRNNGFIYVYEVQSNRLLAPNNVKALLKAEEYDWLTLVTCEDYDQTAGGFNYRRMVRATLISIIPVK